MAPEERPGKCGVALGQGLLRRDVCPVGRPLLLGGDETTGEGDVVRPLTLKLETLVRKLVKLIFCQI